MNRRSRRGSGAVSAGLLGALAACTGCARIEQDRLDVARSSLASLQPAEGQLRDATGPSLSGLDRSGWSELPVFLGVDGTRHHPTLTRLAPAYAQDTARQRGGHPTPESAPDLAGDGPEQVWEALAAPFHGAWDVIMAIPRAVMDPPWSVVTSPSSLYERRGPGDDEDPSGRRELSPAGAPELEPLVAPIEPAPGESLEREDPVGNGHTR